MYVYAHKSMASSASTRPRYPCSVDAVAARTTHANDGQESDTKRCVRYFADRANRRGISANNRHSCARPVRVITIPRHKNAAAGAASSSDCTRNTIDKPTDNSYRTSGVWVRYLHGYVFAFASCSVIARPLRTNIFPAESRLCVVTQRFRPGWGGFNQYSNVFAREFHSFAHDGDVNLDRIATWNCDRFKVETFGLRKLKLYGTNLVAKF